MPSRYEQAVDVTGRSLVLAVVPALATLLSFSKVAQALAARGGGGITFPFPTGLPTLWTYVSLPGGGGTAGLSGPLELVVFFPLFVVGLVVTSALEAGFLGSLARRLDGQTVDFEGSVRRFTLRMIGVNLLRAAVVFLVLPLMFFPPLALLVIIVLTYLIYGLPFEVVVGDYGVFEALEASVAAALAGGPYAGFGAAHLLAGAAGSVLMTWLVRNGGIFGILVGTALVAVPATFVATYGLLVFRDLESGGAHRTPAAAA
ncbi:MAG: hypothetical protein ABEI31_02685 [Halodesulfurarchaeum sp.]